MRLLPDGREIWLYPLLFGKVQLCVAQPGRGWIDHAWQFDSAEAADVAVAHWVEHFDELDEPTGWFRDPHTGRRRPNGDPDKEYIWP